MLISALAREPALRCVLDDSACIGAELWADVQSLRLNSQRGTGDNYSQENKARHDELSYVRNR